MGVGVDKVRRRVTANAYSISCTIMLTKAQVAELETFYNVTTNSGIDVFTWIHHIDDSAANYRFMDPPVYRNVSGNVWRAVLSLEIIP
jgi:hypothetical protein